MSSVLYVTSDCIGAGKTALCTSIAHKLISLGKTVSIFKPLSTETDNGPGEQSTYGNLMGPAPSEWPMILPDNGIEPGIIEKICNIGDQIKGSNDILIVEGLPTISLEDNNRIIEALDANLLAVVEYKPELSSSILAEWSKITKERFLGIVINKMTIYASTDLNNRVLNDLPKQEIPIL